MSEPETKREPRRTHPQIVTVLVSTPPLASHRRTHPRAGNGIALHDNRGTLLRRLLRLRGGPRVFVVLAGVFLAHLGGCHVPGLTPDTRSPADRARELDPRCHDYSAESAAPFLAASSIDSVEPSYSYVKSGPEDRQARLRGARIHVRPLAGMSRETLTRVLECHEARVVLGREPAPPDDPYVLPGEWLDIDVDSEGDGFVVAAQVDAFESAREVLARARRFVGRR